MAAAAVPLFPEPEPKAQPQQVEQPRQVERALVDVQRAVQRELQRLGPKATPSDIAAAIVYVVAKTIISSSIASADAARDEAKRIAEGTHKLLVGAIAERDGELEELREQHAQLVERCEVFEACLRLLETRR